MILDESLEFADAVSVAAAAGTALIGDVVDLSLVGSDLGNGEDMWVVIRTTTEIITAGAAGTIQFFLASDAQAAITTGFTQHLASSVLVSDDAAANSSELNAGGTILMAKLPTGTYERYLGIMCTIATTTVTAGAIDAFLTRNVAKWRSYPNNIQ